MRFFSRGEAPRVARDEGERSRAELIVERDPSARLLGAIADGGESSERGPPGLLLLPLNRIERARMWSR